MSMREKLREIIFGTDTPAGKAFDVVLIISVLASVATVILESVASVQLQYGPILKGMEWFFTILFTLEYCVRLYSVKKASKYVFSFFGVVDLLAFLPSYIGLIISGGHYFLIIRILRVLRIFRVLKLAPFVVEMEKLFSVIKASRRRILVFLLVVFSLVILLGSLMYVIEGEASGFTSIPRSIYWAIVTLTTVGYGDISPQTNLGQTLAAIIMILGYSLIVIPTGFISIAVSNNIGEKSSTKECSSCSEKNHDENARFCKTCGSSLE